MQFGQTQILALSQHLLLSTWTLQHHGKELWVTSSTYYMCCVIFITIFFLFRPLFLACHPHLGASFAACSLGQRCVSIRLTAHCHNLITLKTNRMHLGPIIMSLLQRNILRTSAYQWVLTVLSILCLFLNRLTLRYPVPATLGLDIWPLLVYNIYAATDCKSIANPPTGIFD